MLPSAVVTVLNDAIARAQAYLLSHQAPEGHWVGELEANTTITSEYLLLCHLIDRVDRPKEAKAVRYLRRAQLSDGGWSLFEGGPANLSATIKGYFAMRMAGVSVDDPALAAARERIREMGGPVRADVFTKILLALFGEYDWNGVPAMPVEIMLLPRPFFLFNIYEVSYWSRTVIVPLLIIMDRKPVKWLPPHLALDELWPEPREKTSLRFPRVPKPFSWRTLFWKNFFIAVDDGLKIWERFTTRPLRKRAVEAARVWLEERLAVPGGLGGIYPAMANSILAMRLLGYPDDHPLVLGQLKEIEALGVETDDALHYQPCPSPVWDTGLAINALIESGLPPEHAALRRAAEWLIDRQILVPGDWQVERPHVRPGGWAFQYHNDFYPDLDDTAMVLMAPEQVRGLDGDAVRSARTCVTNTSSERCAGSSVTRTVTGAGARRARATPTPSSPGSASRRPARRPGLCSASSRPGARAAAPSSAASNTSAGRSGATARGRTGSGTGRDSRASSTSSITSTRSTFPSGHWGSTAALRHD